MIAPYPKSIISAKRERLANEIPPVSAEHSRTKENNDQKYGAINAMDLDFDTPSYTKAGSDGATWIKLTLDQVRCIAKGVWIDENEGVKRFWTCSSTDCSKCEGSCDKISITVSIEGAAPDTLPPVSHCRYGDTVKIQKNIGINLEIYEFAIVEKHGKSLHSIISVIDVIYNSNTNNDDHYINSIKSATTFVDTSCYPLIPRIS